MITALKAEVSYRWEHYRAHVVRSIATFALWVISVVLSDVGWHLFAILALVGAIVLLVYILLTLPMKLFGIVVGLAGYLVLLLTFIYCFSNIYVEHGITSDGEVTHDQYNALYFSMVTWTTLGYGDFQPTPDARFWASFEALLGYVFMGILVGLTVALFTPVKSQFSGKTPARKPHQKWGRIN